jgi:hypothetical protein
LLHCCFDLEERFGAFFIDYSLLPLLVQHNYVDAAKQGLFRAGPGRDEGLQLEKLAQAAGAVSDMDGPGGQSHQGHAARHPWGRRCVSAGQGYCKYFVFEMKKDIRSFFSTIKGQ